jgi:hypothetical protein
VREYLGAQRLPATRRTAEEQLGAHPKTVVTDRVFSAEFINDARQQTPVVGAEYEIRPPAYRLMTLPGEQFVIRRQAYAMIKKAFDENGIKFAFPTVQVAGEGDTSAANAAVAQRALELAKPAAA